MNYPELPRKRLQMPGDEVKRTAFDRIMTVLLILASAALVIGFSLMLSAAAVGMLDEGMK